MGGRQQQGEHEDRRRGPFHMPRILSSTVGFMARLPSLSLGTLAWDSPYPFATKPVNIDLIVQQIVHHTPGALLRQIQIVGVRPDIIRVRPQPPRVKWVSFINCTTRSSSRNDTSVSLSLFDSKLISSGPTSHPPQASATLLPR